MRTTYSEPQNRISSFVAALAVCLLALCASLAFAPARAFADGALITSKETAEKGTDALENTDTYLYRIGNDNAVDLGTLFSELDAADIDDETVTVTVTQHTTANGYSTDDCDSDLSATITLDTSDWTAGTIQFSDRTGVVSIEITDATSTSFTLLAEVVDGTNLFEGDIDADTASSSKTYSKTDLVLLGDQKIGSGYYIGFSSCTVYGNGFTIDASEGTVANGTYFGIVLLTNASLDNVSVVGPEFSTSQIGFYSGKDYSVATVRTSGECSLTNCYVSGGHCALKVESGSSTCTVTDSVFVGGNWANIEVKYGELIIEGTVTTVNEPNSSVSSVGLGIVVGAYELLGTDTDVSITINGTLNQYNWVSSSSDSSYLASDVKTLVEFAEKISTVNGYTNMGILFLDEDAQDDSTGMPSGYAEGSATYSSYTRYIWYPTSISDDGLTYRSAAYTWEAEAQGCYEPTYTWSYPEAVYTSDQLLTISIDSGYEYTLEDVSRILTAVKHGNELSIGITIENPSDITDELSYDSSTDSITFSEAGTYTVVYAVDDPCVYGADGARVSAVVHNVELSVIVQVNDTSIKEPEFTFTDGSTTYSSTIVEIGTDTYVMPDSTVLDYVTYNGEKVYYVTVDALYSTSSSDLYRYLPVFSGVTIKNYTDADGTYVTYDSGYDSDDSGTLDTLALNTTQVSGAMTIAYSWDGGFVMQDNLYCYKSHVLNRSSDASADWVSERTGVMEWTFEAGNGITYHYYIGYHCEEVDTYTSCIPTGTQITLADGSTVAVEDLTGDEELLVFDHETGTYSTSSIYGLLDYGEDDYEVVTLTFSDGSQTELIYEHGYFDLTQNKYVYINADTLYDYLGDEFVVGDGESISTVTLTDVAVETRTTGCYSLITNYQLNYFVDGFLSMPGNLDLFANIFEFGDDLTYDAALMAADIEEYGLFSYTDFEDYISEDAFEYLNVKYLKVAIGKGYITFDEILDLIELYSAYLS